MKDFQILIPMTGNGSRFKKAGYKTLKPFIEIYKKPMIEWVVKLFPGDENKINFICREDHLRENSYFKKTLETIAPRAKIIALEGWEKKGPAYDILSCSNKIDDSKPTIVSYCDYFMKWDYTQFKTDVLNKECDGAIPTYTGFHPNLIPEKNLYASCKTDKFSNLLEIREKYSWHKEKSKSLHSPGTYYFKEGGLMKRYIEKMINANDTVNSEYYMSLPYNYMVQDGLTIWCPTNVKKFCQWGTPRDLEEFLKWQKIIKLQEEEEEK